MPSDSRRSPGLPLPSLGQWLMTALALCLGWFLWSEYELRSEVVDLSHPPADPVKYLQAVETVVERGRDGIPDLLVALSSDNTKARVYAIYALGRIGPQAGEAVTPVCDRLRDANAGVREMAAVALRHLCPQREDVAPRIVSLLDDADASVRKAVTNELVDLGSAARPTIIALLESERSALRKEAVRILRAWRLADKHDVLAEVSPAVRRMTSDAELDVQGEARMALVDWELADADDIRRLLHSGQAEQIDVALKGLFSRRLAVHSFLPDLFALLDNPQLDSVPVAASYAQHPWLRPLLELLMLMQTASQPAAPRLFRLLDVTGGRDRVLVLRTLRAIDADREEMIRVFGSLVRDADSRVAGEAAHLLNEISPEAARQQAWMLVRELQKAEGSTIPATLDAIGHLGPQAGEAVPLLISLLGSSHRSIAEAAVSALGEIGADAALAAPALAELVARDAVDADYRAKIVTAIGKIGPSARAALPVLLGILKQPEPAVSQRMIPGEGYDRAVRFRAAAIGAVGRIAIDTPDIAAAMRLQTASRNPAIRAAALDALASLAPSSQAVVGDLRTGLQDLDPDVRIYAALALARMTSDRDDVVAALIESLADDQLRVRTAAAVALGRIGPPARQALPVLQDMLRDDSGRTFSLQLQLHAMPMMMRIGPPPVPELRQLSLRQAVLAALARIDPQVIEGESSATAAP